MVRKISVPLLTVLFSFGVLVFASSASTDAGPVSKSSAQSPEGSAVKDTSVSKSLESEKKVEEAKPAEEAKEEGEARITVSFSNDMTLAQALASIAEDAGVNIVISPEVTDTITSISFTDTPWEEAIKTMVKAYGYGYEKIGNTIIVKPIDKIIETKKKEMELQQVKEVETRVFELTYIDAGDALKIVESFLSPRGTAEILEMTYLGGWKFVASEERGKMEKSERKQSERKSRSKKLIVTDIKSVLDKVEAVLKEIDKMPKLVLIESSIVEVDWRKLVDLGAQFMTGLETADPYMAVSYKGEAVREIVHMLLGSNYVDPYGYEQVSGIGLDPINRETFVGGGSFLFKHLTGNQFTLGLRALEDMADANVLSTPKVLTVSNQEASILVGTKYPILSIDKEISNGTVSLSVDLEYYQDIGIQLNVVPQICGDDYINLIVHPAVVNKSGEVSPGLGDATEGTAVSYPIMEVREAETQVMMRSGDTLVIGGLMRDEEKTGKIGVPLVSDLPILGKLFTRKFTYKYKNDLFIFLTSKIVDPTAPVPEVDVATVSPEAQALLSPSLPEMAPEPGLEELAEVTAER